MDFNLKNNLVADSSTANKYSDVLVHVAFKDTVKRFKAHKFVLAQHSKYFDNIFLCNDNMPLVHICFSSVHPDIVENTLKVMYGYQIHVLEKHLARFKGFLDTLAIDYETVDVALRDEDKETKIDPPKLVLPPPTSAGLSVDTVEQRAENNVPKRKKESPKTTDEKKKKLEEATKTQQTTSSQMIIRKQLDALPAIDKWTETSEDRLDDIDFKIEIDEKKGKFYKCDHCEYVHNLFTEAEKHFIHKHQDCGNAPQIFKDAIKYYQESSTSCAKIREQLAGNCNKALAKNKLM